MMPSILLKFLKIYSEKIKTKIYKPTNNSTTYRTKNTKTKIDTVNLFKQFEKCSIQNLPYKNEI